MVTQKAVAKELHLSMRRENVKRISSLLSAAVFLTLASGFGTNLFSRPANTESEAAQITAPPVSITILYDNYPYQKGLKTDHGFSCLIRGTEKNVLFDTGANPEILFQNFAALKIDPLTVDLVVISHTHGDHAGGLLQFLAKKGECQVFLPSSASPVLVKNVESAKGKVVLVKDPLSVCEGVFSTGPIENEQALVVDTPQGLVILTGCAHPGIVRVVEKAKSVMPKEIYLVMGGFHLADRPQADLEQISRRLRELGVKNLGASHCTGDEAIALFKKDFGKNYIPLGVGKEIVIR
jgi:7,8-dihydropterin-6-yl-methyl-4-(beta-D-ribofuranosyl)aminobenzene 5'-phosphate synthase